MVLGCSLSQKKGVVSDKRISGDLDAVKFKPTKGFVDWSFKEDANRCFKIVESGVDGDLSHMILDLRATQMLGDRDVMVISGNLIVDYKKDASGDWKLDKVESKDVEGKTISFNEATTTFAENARPICAYFTDMPKYRK